MDNIARPSPDTVGHKTQSTSHVASLADPDAAKLAFPGVFKRPWKELGMPRSAHRRAGRPSQSARPRSPTVASQCWPRLSVTRRPFLPW